MNKQRSANGYIRNPNAFMIHELLVSLLMLSILFYSTSLILYHLQKNEHIKNSTEVLAFEQTKNRIERDLRIAEHVSIKEDEIQYTVSGISKRYFIDQMDLVCQLNGIRTILKSDMVSMHFIKQEAFLKVTFHTTNYHYEALILYV